MKRFEILGEYTSCIKIDSEYCGYWIEGCDNFCGVNVMALEAILAAEIGKIVLVDPRTHWYIRV